MEDPWNIAVKSLSGSTSDSHCHQYHPTRIASAWCMVTHVPMRNSEREEMYQQVVMLLTQQTHAYMNVVMMWSYKVCCRWVCMQQRMSHPQALQEPELTRGNGLAAGGSVQGWGRIQRSQKTSAVQPENDASVQVHIGGESTLHDTLHIDTLRLFLKPLWEHWYATQQGQEWISSSSVSHFSHPSTS